MSVFDLIYTIMLNVIVNVKLKTKYEKEYEKIARQPKNIKQQLTQNSVSSSEEKICIFFFCC